MSRCEVYVQALVRYA